MPVEERRGVYGDDARLLAGLPHIDRQNRTITVYDSRHRVLLTFSVSDADFNLPADTWKTGDDIRYYYKEPGQALRMMNVTRTEVSEAGRTRPSDAIVASTDGCMVAEKGRATRGGAARPKRGYASSIRASGKSSHSITSAWS